MVDEAHARSLMARWEQSSGTTVPLEIVECPDRRLNRAAGELARRTTADGRTALTLLLPRRTYLPIVGRILHRGTGEGLARSLEQLPDVAVTILPFDVERAVEALAARSRGGPQHPAP